jgi:hypothetical protein
MPGDDDLPAFLARDLIARIGLDPNRSAVPLAELCGALGIAGAPHERRARRHAALAAGMRRIADDDGHPCWQLRVDLVPLWLTTLDASAVDAALRPALLMHQRDAASILWQSFRPQGFAADDMLVGPREAQTPAEQAYVAALALANLARQQMLVERQIDARMIDGNRLTTEHLADLGEAETLARAVRRVATIAAQRSRRNEYGGVAAGLYRQFGLASYRRMPPARLREALEWLERWAGDLLGEPEPPPDI